MGYSLQIDAEEAVPLASNTGWGELSRWAEKQDAPLLNHLCRYGWVGDPAGLAKELRKLAAPKHPDTRETFRGLLRSLGDAAGAEVVSVTDGMGP